MGSFAVEPYPNYTWVDNVAVWHKRGTCLSFGDGRGVMPRPPRSLTSSSS